MTHESSAVCGVSSLRIESPPDPLAFLAQSARSSGTRFFWSAWDDDLVIAASGLALVAAASGPDRLAKIGVQIAASPLGSDPEAPAWAAPKWLGGFGFSEERTVGWEAFEPAWFYVPERMLVVRGGEAYLTIVVGADKGERMDVAMRAGLEHLDAAKSHRIEGEAEISRASTGKARLERALKQIDGHTSPPDELVIEHNASTLAFVPRKQVAIEPDASLPASIERAIAAVRDGRATKVVFATYRNRRMATPPDPIATLARMRELQPGCTYFLVAPSDDAALVGATPERLVRVVGDRLDTMALAGTAPRGADAATDILLGSALTTSAKDGEEHEHVVQGIQTALSDCDLHSVEAPMLRRLATVQHLETQLVGQRPAGATALSLAARLHPTPALGGTPTRQALRLIKELEPTGRGWYGGAVGWLNESGDGDLAVVIRALLLTGDIVTAFAGAGLVAASDPVQEAREIELKLSAALSAVDGGLA